MFQATICAHHQEKQLSGMQGAWQTVIHTE